MIPVIIRCSANRNYIIDRNTSCICGENSNAWEPGDNTRY